MYFILWTPYVQLQPPAFETLAVPCVAVDCLHLSHTLAWLVTYTSQLNYCFTSTCPLCGCVTQSTGAWSVSSEHVDVLVCGITIGTVFHFLAAQSLLLDKILLSSFSSIVIVCYSVWFQSMRLMRLLGCRCILRHSHSVLCPQSPLFFYFLLVSFICSDVYNVAWKMDSSKISLWGPPSLYVVSRNDKK